MVLMPCRECGDRMSSEAGSCPHCGAPNVFLRDERDEPAASGGTAGLLKQAKDGTLRLGAWVLGVFLGLMALTALFEGSLLSACGLAVLAVCILPPAVDRITWPGDGRKIAAILGGGLFVIGAITAPIGDTDAGETKSRAATVRDSVAQAKQARKDSLYVENSDSIKAAIREAVSSGSDEQALSIITEWARASHGDLDSLFNSIRERQVLHDVRQVPASDLKTNIRMYRELTQLAPDNNAYAAKLEHYTSLQREKEAEEARIRARFGDPPTRSAWDGNYREVEDYLKRVANDPGSIEMQSCTDVYRGENGWLIGCTYRGRNAFGAMILTANWFTIRNGEVVRVQDEDAYKW